MAVGDIHTSSITWTTGDVSKPPADPKPPAPTPEFPARHVYTSATEYGKQDIEASTPTINPDAVVPFLVGRQRAFSPQCLWFGNFRTKYDVETHEETTTTTERIPLGSYNEFIDRDVITTKNVTTYTPVDYYMTVVVGLCLGPLVRLRAIYADNVKIWDCMGVDTDEGLNVIDINSLDSPTGQIRFYSGKNVQTKDPFLSSLIGEDNNIGFNGTAYVIIPTIASKDYGSSSLSYEIERSEFFNQLYDGEPTTNATGDVNAAEMIFQIMRSDWSALAIPVGYIDDDSFRDFYDRCETRNYYLSFLEGSEDFGSSFISTICGLIGAFIYVDMEDELIKVKEFYHTLYDPDDAILFDEDDVIAVQGLERVDWDVMPTHFACQYTSRKDNYKKVSINRMSRSVNTDNKKSERRQVTIPASLACEKDVARKLLTRSIMHNGVPTMQLELLVKTKGQKIGAGDYIKFSWARYDIEEAPFWITNVKNTDTDLNQVVLAGYYLGRPDVDDFDDDEEDSNWTKQDTNPITPVHVEIVTDKLLPNVLKRMGIRGAYHSYQDEYACYALALVRAETDAQLVTTVYKRSNGAIVKKNLRYCASGFISGGLSATYRRDDGYIGDLFLTDGTKIDIVDTEGGIGYCNGEWFGFRSATKTGEDVILHKVERGLWGSVMVAHADGDCFYMIDDSNRLIGPESKGAKRNYDFVSTAFSGKGVWPDDAYQAPQVEFFDAWNLMDGAVKFFLDGQRIYLNSRPTLYLDTDYHFSWVNQNRKTTTKDGINDDQSSFELGEDPDEYHVILNDFADDNIFLGVSFTPLSDICTYFGFTDMVINVPDDGSITNGFGYLYIEHRLGHSIGNGQRLLFDFQPKPGVITELPIDYRIGFAADLTIDFAIDN